MVECVKVIRTLAPSSQPSPSAEASFEACITEKLEQLDSRWRIAKKRIIDIFWELQMDMEQSMNYAVLC